MLKTWGFYQIENYLREYQSWPNSKGFRGFGCVIFVFINFVWGSYPFIFDAINFQTNFYKLLYTVQFLFFGLMVGNTSIKLISDRDSVFKMITLLTNLNRFGIPKRNDFLERLTRPTLKVIRFIGCMSILIIIYSILLKIAWPEDRNMACNYLMMDYYVPFNPKPWQKALIVLFQIYSFSTILNVCTGALFFHSYCLELLVIHLEHLIYKIDNISFEIGQKKCVKLEKVILYHQNIFRAFCYFNNLLNVLSVAQRFIGVTCVITSTIGFVSSKDLANFMVIIISFVMLLTLHITGQRITTAANNVNHAIYNLNWYNVDVKMQRNILIFLCMSQRELTVNLPFFGSLSHPALAKECKGMYVWFNWIAKLSKKKKF